MQAHRMKQRGAPWTPELDAQLKQLVEAGTPRAKIAKIMERTLRGIERRITEKTLRQDLSVDMAVRSRFRWTAQEDHQFELMLEGKATIPEVCATLERTERSLRERADSLGLRPLFDRKVRSADPTKTPGTRKDGDGGQRHRHFRKPLSDLYDMWARAMVWT